jgi:hypothetical protein
VPVLTVTDWITPTAPKCARSDASSELRWGSEPWSWAISFALPKPTFCGTCPPLITPAPRIVTATATATSAQMNAC